MRRNARQRPILQHSSYTLYCVGTWPPLNMWKVSSLSLWPPISFNSFFRSRDEGRPLDSSRILQSFCSTRVCGLSLFNNMQMELFSDEISGVLAPGQPPPVLTSERWTLAKLSSKSPPPRCWNDVCRTVPVRSRISSCNPLKCAMLVVAIFTGAAWKKIPTERVWKFKTEAIWKRKCSPFSGVPSERCSSALGYCMPWIREG